MTDSQLASVQSAGETSATNKNMAASMASILTSTTATTTSSASSKTSSPSRAIPTAAGSMHTSAALSNSLLFASNPLMYSGSLPNSYGMLSSSAPPIDAGSISNSAHSASPATNSDKPALVSPNFELLSASLAELNNKLQQQAALAAIAQQHQPSAAASNQQLAEEQQRLLQAHVRAFLERKQQQGSSDKLGSASSFVNNPALSGSGSASSSDKDDRIEKLKSKSRADCSANASNEVKQRLQEFVLQKRRREAAGRYSSTNWASSQQASTEHGSSPSSSTAGTGDASPPTTVAVRLQSGHLLDESHQLRKTASEPNLKVRTLIKQRVMERRQSPLVKRSSKLNIRRRSPLAAGTSPTRSGSDSGPNSPSALAANNRSGSNSSLNTIDLPTAASTIINGNNSNNSVVGNNTFRFQPPQTSSSLISSSTSAFVDKQQSPQPSSFMQPQPQTTDLNALSSFTSPSPSLSTANAMMMGGHPVTSLLSAVNATAIGGFNPSMLSSSTISGVVRAGEPDTGMPAAAPNAATAALLDQIAHIQQLTLLSTPSTPNAYSVAPPPGAEQLQQQNVMMLAQAQLALANSSALQPSVVGEQQNVLRLLQAAQQEQQHQALQIIASLIASQQQHHLQQQAAAALASPFPPTSEPQHVVDEQANMTFSPDPADASASEGESLDKHATKQLNRTHSAPLPIGEALALQQSISQLQNDPARLKQFLEQQQHAYAKHQLRQAVLQRANSKNVATKQATIEEGQEDPSEQQHMMNATSASAFAAAGSFPLSPAALMACMGVHAPAESADDPTRPMRSGSFGSAGMVRNTSHHPSPKKQRSLSYEHEEDSESTIVTDVGASPVSSPKSTHHHHRHHSPHQHHHHHHSGGGSYHAAQHRASPKIGKKPSPISSSPPKSKLTAALSQQMGRPLARALSSPLVLNSFPSGGLALSAAAASAAQYQMQLQAMKHGGLGGGRATTGLAYDPIMLEHGCMCGDKDGAVHPEHPERLANIWRRLDEHGYIGLCERITSRKATLDELQLCHSEAYVLLLGSNPINRQKLDLARLSQLPMKSFCLLPCGGIGVDADTPWNEFTTASAARTAVGLSIDLALRVAIGELKNGFALVRPPGHHAERELAMGFCFFNTVAIAARVLKERLHLVRILVIDIDLHHCNGIQNILYDDAEVLVMSIHRYDNGNYFPGTGNVNEVGSAGAQGFNVNIAFGGNLDPPMTDVEYLAAFRTVVLPIAQQFNPDIVLVAAGFTAAAGHEAPMGGYIVSPNCFAHLTRALMSLANGKVVLVLEGGFNVDVVGECTEACLQALLGAPLEPLPEAVLAAKPNRPCTETLIAVLSVHLPFWPTLARQATTLGMSIRQAERHEREAASTVAALASLTVAATTGKAMAGTESGSITEGTAVAMTTMNSS